MVDAIAPLLDDASVALVESPHAAKVLAVVAADGRATLVHADACQFERTRQLVIATDATQAMPAIEALQSTRRDALVACHIQTFRSLQVRGDDADGSTRCRVTGPRRGCPRRRIRLRYDTGP
jgi:hypothetical protein